MDELEFLKPINRNIYAYRKASGYTQGEVADLLGLERNTYAKLERYGNPTVDMIKKMSEAFRVPMHGFFYNKSINISPIIKESAFPKKSLETKKPPPLFLNSPNVFDDSKIVPTKSEAEIIRMLRALKDDDRQDLTRTIKKIYNEKKKKTL